MLNVFFTACIYNIKCKSINISIFNNLFYLYKLTTKRRGLGMKIKPCNKEKELVTKLAWRSFTILAICFVVVSFYRTSISTLAVNIMHDFQVGGGLMSVMSSAFFYPY